MVDVPELELATLHERVEALGDLGVERRLLVALERVLPDGVARSSAVTDPAASQLS